MPTTVIEHYESQEISRTADTSTVEIKANVTGSEDTVAVESDFFAWLGGLSAVSGLQLKQTNVKHIGGGVHEAYATYVDEPPDIVKVIRYRTTGQTARILQAFSSIYSVQANPSFNPGLPVGPSNQPTMSGPDFGGLIGVTRDGVEGVDVPIPSFSFSIDYRFSSVTQAYLYNCAKLTGCVNSTAYLGFAIGELLFMGIEGQVSQTSGGAIKLSDSPISFNFEASPNLTNIVVGPFTIPFKYGWDYLWPRTVEDTSNNAVIRKTISVHIDRPLRWDDLSALGI